MRSIRLYWWRAPNGESNFGDDLSPLVVRHLSARDVVFRPVAACDLVAIGSVINAVVDKQWKRALRFRLDRVKVWGTGSFESDRLQKHRGLDFFAVRGPLTRDAMNLPPAIALGDPGLLVDRLKPATSKRYRWGIIPHVVDQDQPIVSRMRNDTSGSIVIDMKNPDPVQVIREIASCEFIISSSLHGVIAADALGIPHLWTKMTGDVLHADWKFRDYFLSVGREAPDPVAAVPDLRVLETRTELARRDIIAERQAGLEASFARMNL